MPAPAALPPFFHTHTRNACANEGPPRSGLVTGERTARGERRQGGGEYGGGRYGGGGGGGRGDRWQAGDRNGGDRNGGDRNGAAPGRRWERSGPPSDPAPRWQQHDDRVEGRGGGDGAERRGRSWQEHDDRGEGRSTGRGEGNGAERRGKDLPKPSSRFEGRLGALNDDYPEQSAPGRRFRGGGDDGGGGGGGGAGPQRRLPATLQAR